MPPAHIVCPVLSPHHGLKSLDPRHNGGQGHSFLKHSPPWAIQPGPGSYEYHGPPLADSLSCNQPRGYSSHPGGLASPSIRFIEFHQPRGYSSHLRGTGAVLPPALARVRVHSLFLEKHTGMTHVTVQAPCLPPVTVSLLSTPKDPQPIATVSPSISGWLLVDPRDPGVVPPPFLSEGQGHSLSLSLRCCPQHLGWLLIGLAHYAWP